MPSSGHDLDPRLITLVGTKNLSPVDALTTSVLTGVLKK
jgi:hypothetical protein